MAKLTTQGRNKIASKNFALPGRRFPIEDASHARNALSRAGAKGRKRMAKNTTPGQIFQDKTGMKGQWQAHKTI